MSEALPILQSLSPLLTPLRLDKCRSLKKKKKRKIPVYRESKGKSCTKRHIGVDGVPGCPMAHPGIMLPACVLL